MLKYYNYLIGLQEIPDEVSLVINISNCPFKCKGCHAEMLRKDVGDPLDKKALDALISPLQKKITCVVFMGGDIAPDEINSLAAHIRAYYPMLKIGWYSGDDTIGVFTEYPNFDYIKIGPYKRKYGPLTSKTTNQRMFRLTPGGLEDITHRFWR